MPNTSSIFGFCVQAKLSTVFQPSLPTSICKAVRHKTTRLESTVKMPTLKTLLTLPRPPSRESAANSIPSSGTTTIALTKEAMFSICQPPYNQTIPITAKPSSMNSSMPVTVPE